MLGVACVKQASCRNTCCFSRFVKHVPVTQSSLGFFFSPETPPTPTPTRSNISCLRFSLSREKCRIRCRDLTHCMATSEMARGCGQRASTTRYSEMVDSGGSDVWLWGPSDTGLIPVCDFSMNLAQDGPEGPQFLDWMSFFGFKC